jgi:hypothetical protein
VVAARFFRNDRLTDALMAQAFAALAASPGARAPYDAERAPGKEHNPALRKLANRLIGIPPRMPHSLKLTPGTSHRRQLKTWCRAAGPFSSPAARYPVPGGLAPFNHLRDQTRTPR